MSTLQEKTIKSPSQLAHIAIRTNQLQALSQWYCTVLGARVAHGSDKVAFLTYDEEHHRVALLALDEYAPKSQTIDVGHYHTGFSYDSLADLIETYSRLKDAGITPYRSINHGPTVSFYYADPDGNQIELQVDTFPTSEEAYAWMSSEAYRNNPIGIEFDAEEMIEKHRNGVPDLELLRRPDSTL